MSVAVILVISTTAVTRAEFVTVRQVGADRGLTDTERMSLVLVAARIMTDGHFPAARRGRRDCWDRGEDHGDTDDYHCAVGANTQPDDHDGGNLELPFDLDLVSQFDRFTIAQHQLIAVDGDNLHTDFGAAQFFFDQFDPLSQQRTVGLDDARHAHAVADLLQPAGDRAFGDGFADRFHGAGSLATDGNGQVGFV